MEKINAGAGDLTEAPTSESADPKAPFFIVGIGASAGGLDSLEKLFKNMIDKSGMAFVVIQHLSPDYKSLMVELLSKHTRMKIHRAEDDMPVVPDNVYLIPRKRNLTISDGRLHLEGQEAHGLNLPIDVFLKSLAEDHGERAIGIILSGTGSDGSRGLRSIKERGGLVLVQESGSAKFDGMPSSAISTGLVDFILTPEKMPGELLRYIQHPYSARSDESGDLPQEKVNYLNEALGLLKERSGVDFSLYKLTTVNRRIERRMSINQIDTVGDYTRLLRESPGELDTLHRELLIGVTSFFRDPEAFRIIESTVIPAIFHEKPANEPLRCWSVGCSTGEEPYSLAMLIKKYMENVGKPTNVKIFATDVDPRAISVAGEGIYSQSIIADVPNDMIARYFTKMGNKFQIIKDIREMVIFARHNAIKDPPFNKIDLISCRNFLIYLTPEAQKKLLSYFQFSLKTNGYLFLGSSETVGEYGAQFSGINHRWKIYRYISDRRVPIGQTAQVTPIQAYVQNRDGARPETSAHSIRRKVIDSVKDLLIELYVPASVAITEKNEPLVIFGDVNRFLKIPTGEANFDVVNLMRKDLSATLSTAMHKAAKDNEEVIYQNIRVREGKRTATINLRVRPIEDHLYNQRLTLITFEDVSPEKAEKAGRVEVIDVSHQARQRIEDLEQELQYTRENLQATIEELETTNEELQATNEELMSANEELQSTNEELQSVNEELITVNAEYQAKIQELVELNDDMNNLLASTEIGTIFLDKNLLIRKFTPAITRTVNLIDMDVGRPINHITHNITDENLVSDVDRVLKTLVPVEKDVRSKDGKWYMLRIHPYRTKDNYIKGIVITFIDITEKVETEQALAESENMYRAFFRNLPNAMAYHRIILDDEGSPVDFVFIDVNEPFEDLFGLRKDRLIGRRIRETKSRLTPIKLENLHRFSDVALTGETTGFDQYVEGIDRWYRITAFSPREAYFVSYFEDITEQKAQTRQGEQREADLQAIIREQAAEIEALKARLGSLSEGEGGQAGGTAK
jgi:two-component system, chemotaxis family, CheB/CheR fusion protein